MMIMKTTLAILLALSVFFPTAGMASSVDIAASVTQGFNFNSGSTDVVGHLNSLKIGSHELIEDLAVTDPVNISGANLKIAGVMSSLFWGGNYSDPIQFSTQVTTENKSILTTMINAGLSDLSVEFQFTFYEYDLDAYQYFKAFHSNGNVLMGEVEKSGGDLNMFIDLDQSQEVTSPKNFTLYLGVMPADIQQELHLATDLSSKFVKKWGVGSSPVPIPSAVWLFGSGLAGLVAIRKRENN